MRAYIFDGRVMIEAPYEDREIIKALGDYRWNKDQKAWEFPTRKLPYLIDHLNIKYGDDVEKVLQEELSRAKERRQLLDLADKIKTKSEFALPNLTTHFIPVELYDKLFIHQKQALSISSLFNSYALFMETGTGKTLVAIRLIQLHKLPTLIVCPLSVIESVWMSELDKWAPGIIALNLWEYMKQYNGIPAQTALYKEVEKKVWDVCIINFESFKKISNPEKYFQFIIVDESSKMKSHSTQISKKLVALNNKIPYRVIMSGLPAPNDLLEYWAQLCFINSGLLGENFFRFRNIYFKGSGYGNFTYFAKRGSKELIMQKVSEQAFFIKKIDCLDLPDRIFEVRNIELDDIQTQVYNEMLKTNIVEFKNHTTLAMNELAKIMKLRQITSGFTITSEQFPVKVSDNKLNTLIDFIEDELPPDQQTIIWCQFHYEIDMITEYLNKKYGAKENAPVASKLYGEISQAQKEFNIKAFQNKEVRFLVAHPKSGGMGLTFTNCNYMIWFSLSYSQEEHAQANDRIYRIGQLNKCTYIYILAKNTIDEIIYKALRKKQNLAERCLEMLKGKS